ncbi:hypothetical protein NDU88_007610 [Pleurodeles waltl]|uniref:Uncharacterized protein n=1 Tax=Pleurodeles waltl TaxID=8319 RepID=A0AAV7QL85_PLEWA|nr:hypothetical protein NDU88_007610 [Pleurodeles waltl]
MQRKGKRFQKQEKNTSSRGGTGSEKKQHSLAHVPQIIITESYSMNICSALLAHARKFPQQQSVNNTLNSIQVSSRTYLSALVSEQAVGNACHLHHSAHQRCLSMNACPVPKPAAVTAPAARSISEEAGTCFLISPLTSRKHAPGPLPAVAPLHHFLIDDE